MSSYYIVHIVTGKYRTLEGCKLPYTADTMFARVVNKDEGERLRKPGEYLRRVEDAVNFSI